MYHVPGENDNVICLFQAIQHVSDSWWSPIGSTAIMVIIAFFNTHGELYGMDDDRQEWVTWYLKHHYFTYKKADGDDPLVILQLVP